MFVGFKVEGSRKGAKKGKTEGAKKYHHLCAFCFSVLSAFARNATMKLVQVKSDEDITQARVLFRQRFGVSKRQDQNSLAVLFAI